MIFDPFGDFSARGYLRNFAGEKDSEIVKRLEHSSFSTGIDEAFSFLGGKDRITYDDFLDVHRILFEAIYPWAGQDRLTTAAELAISRGDVLFARPHDMRRSVDFGLDLARDPADMAKKPGEIMGYFAYGHPFLDGNGRTIMVVHTELAQRAGISIDWGATDKAQYLTFLTRELAEPGKGHLDGYLGPFVGRAVGHEQLASHVSRTSGLDSSTPSIDQNKVLGSVEDTALAARYEQQELRQEVARSESQKERGRSDGDRGGRER